MRWPRHPSMRTSRSSRASTPRSWPLCSSAAAPPGEPARCSSIAPTGRRAESLGPALEALLPGAEVLHFPAWETLPHERLSPSPEIVGHRLDVLGRIARWTGDDAARRHRIGARRAPAARGRAHRRRRRSQLVVGERGHDLGRRLGPARRTRLPPRRHGLAPRRVRAARRHPRRLPADRRPPVPRRVLRRRGRPDPRLLGRRPAVAARRGRARSTLVAEPRAAAHRRPCAIARGS